MQKSKLFTYIIAVVITVLVGGAIAIAANWTPPTGTPPTNNVDAPLNVGSDLQEKAGALTIGGIFTADGVVKINNQLEIQSGKEICLGGVCKSAWPEATEPTPPAPPAPTAPVVNGTCGLSSGRVFAFAPTTELCQPGIPSAVSNSGTTWSWLCNGSGTGISAPCTATRETEWLTVATAHKPSQGTNSTWATEKVTPWTANGPIRKVRVSGRSDDGGYCYASWGTGHVETYRHDPSTGVYNVNNGFYEGAATCIQTWDEMSQQYYCEYGLDCPSNPPLFTNDGTAKICQTPWSKGDFATKYTPGLVDILPGTAFTLKSNFVDGPGNGHVDCAMDVLYK